MSESKPGAVVHLLMSNGKHVRTYGFIGEQIAPADFEKWRCGDGELYEFEVVDGGVKRREYVTKEIFELALRKFGEIDEVAEVHRQRTRDLLKRLDD